MIYRSLGIYAHLASASVVYGYAELDNSGQHWEMKASITHTSPLPPPHAMRLQGAAALPVADYFLLHRQLGEWLGATTQHFMNEHQLSFKVQLIGLQGFPCVKTAEGNALHLLGDAATLAAATGIHVVSDLPLLDWALGGNGAPWHSLARLLGMEQSDDLVHRAFLTAFLAVLRWREEAAFTSSETGASRNSCGGALWSGPSW